MRRAKEEGHVFLTIFKKIKAEHCGLACNPRYSGGRDGEDHSWRPAQAKKLMRPHLNHGGTYLSSQLCRETQIGGLQSGQTWQGRKGDLISKMTKQTGVGMWQ
jgi:hypothetical protein